MKMASKTNENKVWEYKSKTNKDDALAKLVKKDRTIVYTKPTMAKHLIDRITFKDGDVVCEPCRGDGAFYNNFPDNVVKTYYEINEGKDFLQATEPVDYIAANPPFVPRKLFWNFQQKAMEITRKKIYWLINLSAMNVFTPKRLNEMKEQGWYITSQYIVADKRWYGRYVWLEISKEPSDYYTWCKTTF